MSRFHIILIALIFISAASRSFCQASDPIWINAEIGSLPPIDGFLSDDETTLYVLTQERIHVVDAETGEELTQQNDTNFVRHLGESSIFHFISKGDNNRLFAVEQSKQKSRFIELDLITNEIVYEEIFITYTYQFRGLEYSPLTKRVYILLAGLVFDMNTLDYTDRGSSAFPNAYKMTISPDGKYLAAIFYNRNTYREGRVNLKHIDDYFCYCLDVETFELLIDKKHSYQNNQDDYQLKFSPDSKYLAFSFVGHFHVWSISDFTRLTSLSYNTICNTCQKAKMFAFLHSKDLTAIFNLGDFSIADSVKWYDLFVQPWDLSRPAEDVVHGSPNVSFYEITKDDKYYFGVADGVLYKRKIDWKTVGMPLKEDTPPKEMKSTATGNKLAMQLDLPLADTVSMDEVYADHNMSNRFEENYPEPIWRFELPIPSMELGNVKSNILSPDESKLYVLAQRELFVFDAEQGKLERIYRDELKYQNDTCVAMFTSSALSDDGERLYVVGVVWITKDGIEKNYPRFFVLDLKKGEIIYDEIFKVHDRIFSDIVYSPKYERVCLLQNGYITSINTLDYTDRSYYSIISNYPPDKIYMSPTGDYLMATGHFYLWIYGADELFHTTAFVLDPVTLKIIGGTTIESNSFPRDQYREGSFTPDGKYFSIPFFNIMYLYDISERKRFSYYVQDDLKEFRNFYKIDFSKKHHYKGIATMYGEANRTAMIHFSETEDISGVFIKNTGIDFVQIPQEEYFYYEISQDTLAMHVLDWSYITNVSLPEAIRTSHVYPNPVDDLLIVDFELNQANATVVEFINSAGISVRRIDAGLLSEGEHHIGVNVADLPAGVYFTRVRSGRSLITNKFVKVE